MSSEGLWADQVSYGYSGHDVVRDLSLRLRAGDLVALCGPNGAGKTTVLRLLTGVVRPRAGSISLQGTSLARWSTRALARTVSVVPQNIDRHLTFSVEHMVAMGRTPHLNLIQSPGARDRRAIDRALEAADLTSLARRSFAELSGGEQQRVMLAMALAQETELILLDEPTAHLDLHYQHAFLELLHSLHRERGTGVLSIMHDLNLAALYFDRLVLLAAGRLVAEGPVSEVLAHPANLEVFRTPLCVVPHPQTGVPQVLMERGTTWDATPQGLPLDGE